MPHTETKRFQCRHIFTDGHRCGSPSLRHEALCYYHHTTRKPAPHPAQQSARQPEFTLPLPEDRSAIQLSIGQVLQRIAANEIDPKRAGLLLYGLQIASLNLPREAQNKNRTQEEPTQVEEVIQDPTYGPLAPESELAETKRKSIIRILLENLKDESEQEIRVPHPERAEGAKGGESNNPDPTATTEPNILPKIQASTSDRTKTRYTSPNKTIRTSYIYRNHHSYFLYSRLEEKNDDQPHPRSLRRHGLHLRPRPLPAHPRLRHLLSLGH